MRDRRSSRASPGRVRAAVAILLALAIDAAVFVPLRDWDEPAVLAAIGVLVAVLAGAFGGFVAGGSPPPPASRSSSSFDQSTITLIALPAWLAAGARRLARQALASRGRGYGGAARARRGEVPRAHGAPAGRHLYAAPGEEAVPLVYVSRRSTGCSAIRQTRAARPGALPPPRPPRRPRPRRATLAERPDNGTREAEYRLRSRDGRVVGWTRPSVVREPRVSRSACRATCSTSPSAGDSRTRTASSSGPQRRRRRPTRTTVSARSTSSRRPRRCSPRRSTTARRSARSPRWPSASSPIGASSTCARRTARHAPRGPAGRAADRRRPSRTPSPSRRCSRS